MPVPFLDLKPSDTYAEAHLNRAIIVQELGRFEEAQEQLEQILETAN